MEDYGKYSVVIACFAKIFVTSYPSICFLATSSLILSAPISVVTNLLESPRLFQIEVHHHCSYYGLYRELSVISKLQ